MKKEKRQSALLAFLDYDLSKFDAGETSSDESFKIDDLNEGSDFGSSDESDLESDESESNENSSDDEPEQKKNVKSGDVSRLNEAGPSSSYNATEKLLELAKTHSSATVKLLSTPVCCACLGDRSDDSNEIVECDGCKITVHEGCYGVSESVSVSSTVSSCSTEPWFCEACKANVKDPDCELCPNKGGIFKETDCGRWVHLVCALYVPGVAFGEVDQLSMVTLFEMQYNKWGAKSCSLCDDERFARTGVCIGCDAGMCKTYFHVTCAQKAGFLSEAHHEEVDQADPFYAHCKIHSDKTLIKHRKRNYNALLMQMKRHEQAVELNKNEKPTPEQERIERKLKKHRIKYTTNKVTRIEPWVPTQKMPRLITTSASAVKKLMKKADLMGIDAAALEFQEAQIASLMDIRKKWHIPPAFSTEFVGYYLDRSIRLTEMKSNLGNQVEANTLLLGQQQILRQKYDDAIKINQDVQQRQKDLQTEIAQLHEAIISLCPSKQLPTIESIARPLVTPVAVKLIPSPVPTLSSTPPPQLITSRVMSVPTAAALKMGVGFPLNSLRKDDTGRILSTQRISNDDLMNACGICKKCTDQHLLAKCDTCHLHYHLGCLNPPLSRQPKRSKLYAWQCSECDKSDDSATENVVIPKGPRKSRVRYNKDGTIIDPLRDSFGSEKSMALSKKSDESHHRTFNGSELELEEVGKVADVPETPINESITIESVPTTSTPIADIKSQPKVTSSTNKRGRKPKPKPDPELGEIVDLVSPERPKKKAKATKIEDIDPSIPVDLTSPQASLKKSKSKSSSSLDASPVAVAKQRKKTKPKQTAALISDDRVTKVPAPPKEPSENHENDSSQQQQLIVGNMETIASPNFNMEKLTQDGPKIPKKGRPRKEKPSITQILGKLQEKREITLEYPDMQHQQLSEPKPEVTLVSLSGNSCPLAQFQPFIDIPTSNPYPVSTFELTKPLDEPEQFSLFPVHKYEAPQMNGAVVNGEGTTSSGSGHHKHKKQKKHKRRHSNSPSSGDRQLGTKKQKKRKRDKTSSSDGVATNSFDFERSPEQPRIKMKFCAKFVQAGDDKKIMWSLPKATIGNAQTNPALLNSSQGEMYSNGGQQFKTSPAVAIPNGNGHGKVIKTIKKRKMKKPSQRAAMKAAISAIGNSTSVIAPSHFTAAASSAPTSPVVAAAVLNKSLPLPSQICDVCQMPGYNQNLVKCDECQKNYHFTCLMPPLKKTPKKRGYSWHCADCDPTDRENN